MKPAIKVNGDKAGRKLCLQGKVWGETLCPGSNGFGEAYPVDPGTPRKRGAAVPWAAPLERNWMGHGDGRVSSLRLRQSVECTIIRYTCLIKIAQYWNKSER